MTVMYDRTIKFDDTDAAGVVYFANVLRFCHEAYEASLAAHGVDLPTFFGGGAIAVPIVHAAAEFRRPLRCGDRVGIELVAESSEDGAFEIRYTLRVATADKVAATATTRHVCIDATTRQRCGFSPELRDWLRQWAEP